MIRPTSTYSHRGTAWTVGPIEQIKRGTLVLLGRDAGLVTPGYIDNVVDGLMLTLTHPTALGETFNLCDDRAVTFHEFYLAYARMLGKESLPTVPGWFAGLARSAPGCISRRILGPTAGGTLEPALPAQSVTVQRGKGARAARLRAAGGLCRGDAAH